MRRAWARALVAAAALAGLVAAGPALAQSRAPDRAAMARDVAARDSEALRALLQGHFDNELQAFFEPDLGVPAGERTPRAQLTIAPAAGPALGAPVMAALPGGAGGVRLLTFSADPDGLRMRQYAAPAGLGVREGRLDPSGLAAVTAAQTPALAGCDVVWRRVGDAFEARRPAACAADRAAPGWAAADWDGARLSAQGLVLRGPGGAVRDLRRARGFLCWVAVLRGARHGDSGRGLSDWQFQRDLWVHDQGGVLPIVTDETPARALFLRLRRVEWPYGTNRPSLTLYVHEAGDDRALSYAWGAYDADRLGLNLRWLQVSCTHAPDRPVG